MSASTPQPARQDVDPEATAQLPALQVDAVADGATDTCVILDLPDVLSEALTAPLPDLAGSLREIEGRLQRKSERLLELEALLQQGGVMQHALRSELDAQQRILNAQQLEIRSRTQDLLELRQRSAQQEEALLRQQGQRGVFEALLAESDAQLASIGSRLQEEAAAREVQIRQQLEQARSQSAVRIAELESSLHSRVRELEDARRLGEAGEGRAALLADAVQAQRTQITEQLEELVALRANDEAVREGVQLFAGQRTRIEDLGAELAETRERCAGLEVALRASQEQVQKLEAEVRAAQTLLGNLQQNMARLEREDTGARPTLTLAASGPLPERYLESEENGELVRYPLGKRTGIGRTPDNDIQIDVTYVSRHHAVLLCSAHHCIIEDLNSMNGVLINGRKVSRHSLRDGDAVTIGRSIFVFRQPP